MLNLKEEIEGGEGRRGGEEGREEKDNITHTCNVGKLKYQPLYIYLYYMKEEIRNVNREFSKAAYQYHHRHAFVFKKV